MKPLVSILMAAYNSQDLIGESIQSVLAQTWPRKELIIVDDGSTDNTLSVARRFASKEVSVVTQPNQGAGAARNKAYALCQGDYIQGLDHDDLMAPDKIARQMEALERFGTKRTLVSSAWGHFYYRAQKAKFTPTSLWCDLSPVEWLVRKMGQGVHMQGGVWLISRELLETAGLFDTRLTTDDDGEFSCRLILASDGIRFVPEARLFYRLSGANSLSNPVSNKRLETLFLSWQLQINHLRAFEDSERVRSACLSLLNTSSICFYPERPDIFKQCEHLAESLGGKLNLTKNTWKYAWIERMFGPAAAKRTQRSYNSLKVPLIRGWDRTMYQLEKRRKPSNDRVANPA